MGVVDCCTLCGMVLDDGGFDDELSLLGVVGVDGVIARRFLTYCKT